ncbi:MAG: polyribonucleotide nucleotidyltransferase [Chloroflexi bacterium]|nr:polyribonucleotide nucleotidyltransferase [Chloroflexota bacterium]
MAETFSIEFAGRTLSLETGRLAGLAHGAVLVTYGETVVLVTAVSADTPREGLDFFPLTIEFEEKMYAAGKIPGGFFKREGRAGEAAILNARLTDRPLRPLFPKDYRNETQIVITVMSVDHENDPGSLGIVGASAALPISNIPFYGPVGAVTVGYINDQFVINPTLSQLTYSRLNLSIAGTADAVMMVEAGAIELSEAKMVEAIEFGHNAIKELVVLQNRMVEAIGKQKKSYPTTPINEALDAEIRAWIGSQLSDAMFNSDKATRESAVAAVKAAMVAEFISRGYDEKEIGKVFYNVEKETVRNAILDRGIRPDGRGLTEIRPITCEVGVLPRTHGTGLFTRGQTQVLSVATLGTIGDEQIIDGLGIQESKRFIHHYNFPPYSTGETRRMVGPSRRDIGHGHLVERSLLSVIPEESEFPYTIRLVAEVLSSNGSTSMGSVCAGTLALMDAGVPIRAPLSGIAMGLITRDANTYSILTDIQGVEDFLGDMDFKVAGTAEGICGLQMDIKVRGITPQIMREALAQAHDARMFILDKMTQTISETRPQLSPYAPRITKVKVHPDRIRDIIGPGGKTIRRITEETKCTIDIEDDGTVLIGSTSAENAQKAIDMINGLTRDVEVGTVYTGKVTRIMAFGAFVEILPGKEGLVHISELADYRVPTVEDVVKLGDEITVLVTEIDRQGRINLSRRALLAPTGNGEEGSGPPPFQRSPEGAGRPPQGGFNRGGPPRDGGGFRREGAPPFRGGGGPPPRRDAGPRPGFNPGGPRPFNRPGPQGGGDEGPTSTD